MLLNELEDLDKKRLADILSAADELGDALAKKDKINMSLSSAGHVNNGKSKLISTTGTRGNVVNHDPITSTKGPKKYTPDDLDSSEEEKSQGNTMSVSTLVIETSKHILELVDCPGHSSYITNMIYGTFGRDATVFAIAADDPFQPQLIEHYNIVSNNRVKTIIFFINKVDLLKSTGMNLKCELDMQYEEIYHFLQDSFLGLQNAAYVQAGESTLSATEKMIRREAKVKEQLAQLSELDPEIIKRYSTEFFKNEVIVIYGSAYQGDNEMNEQTIYSRNLILQRFFNKVKVSKEERQAIINDAKSMKEQSVNTLSSMSKQDIADQIENLSYSDEYEIDGEYMSFTNESKHKNFDAVELRNMTVADIAEYRLRELKLYKAIEFVPANIDIRVKSNLSPYGVRSIDKLLECLDNLKLPPRPLDLPALMFVKKVLTQKSGMVFTGDIAQGKIQVGDTLELLLPGETIKVRVFSIQANYQSLQIAYAGQDVGIILKSEGGSDKELKESYGSRNKKQTKTYILAKPGSTSRYYGCTCMIYMNNLRSELKTSFCPQIQVGLACVTAKIVKIQQIDGFEVESMQSHRAYKITFVFSNNEKTSDVKSGKVLLRAKKYFVQTGLSVTLLSNTLACGGGTVSSVIDKEILSKILVDGKSIIPMD